MKELELCRLQLSKKLRAGARELAPRKALGMPRQTCSQIYLLYAQTHSFASLRRCANAQHATLAPSALTAPTMKQPSTKAEFDAVLAEAAAAGKAVVVDFTATWCGPCQRIAPLFAQLASEFPQAEFIKVDVDENQETAQACQVSAMPTFMVFRDKKEVGMIRGADPNGLRALIQQHAGDKWSVAGEGQSLGSAQDTGGMSEREKRLAALERRGL